MSRLAALACAAALVPVAAQAQLIAPRIAPGGPSPAALAAAARAAPTPRLPNGKPDLNGFWNGSLLQIAERTPDANGNIIIGSSTRDGTSEGFEDDAQVTSRGRTNKPLYRPEYWDKIRELDWNNGRENNPAFHCFPSWPVYNQDVDVIVQNGDHVAILYERLNMRRLIPTDGRPHDPIAAEGQSWWGDSVGRWDGDTLIIDTVGFNDLSWFSNQGYIHTEKLHVVETLKREGNTLRYTVTVDDPMLMEPWKLSDQTQYLNTDPEADLWDEDPCVERDDEGTDARPEVGR